MYCPKPQQSRVSVRSPQGNYSLFAQNNRCRVAISFGYTTPQLFEGKSVTRRCWKDSYAQQFIKRWQRGITTYIALDKDRRWGGKQIGWITLTCCPYKQRLSDMPQSDLAAEGFPELNAQEFIQRFFKGNDQQRVWVIRFKFTPELEDSCSARISSNLDAEGIDNGCSAIGRSPGGENCSARISRKPDEVKVSPTKAELPPQFQVGDRVHHRKQPQRPGTILSSSACSTRYKVGWDAGSVSAIEARNLERDNSPKLPDMGGLNETQNHWLRMARRSPKYQPEKTDNCSAIGRSNVDETKASPTDDKQPPQSDVQRLQAEINKLKETARHTAQRRINETAPQLQTQSKRYQKMLAELEAEELEKRRGQIQTLERKLQRLTIPAEQTSDSEGGKLKKSRNTKPGRGSRPKQVNCNVKRNGSKGKSPNSYWVYQFSFKVDGKYFNRSCSIPKEKVNRAIEMWESKQYSWREIVEYIGKNSDKIVEKAGGKNNGIN